jgi:hypothetical protein
LAAIVVAGVILAAVWLTLCVTSFTSIGLEDEEAG